MRRSSGSGAANDMPAVDIVVTLPPEGSAERRSVTPGGAVRRTWSMSTAASASIATKTRWSTTRRASASRRTIRPSRTWPSASSRSGKRTASTVGPALAHEMPLPLLPTIEQTEISLRAPCLEEGRPAPGLHQRQGGGRGLRSGEETPLHARRVGLRLPRREADQVPLRQRVYAGHLQRVSSSHPAAILHDNASIGHSDPRLGLVNAEDGPLLRTTGAHQRCVSRWGKDAAYDMVGNVDEWIDDPEGTFVGGFFSRSTKEGCDSIVTVHPLHPLGLFDWRALLPRRGARRWQDTR